MLIDAPGIRRRLHGIVMRLAPPPFREDFMQEAMIHLWRLEEQDPGMAEAWYLQGCRLYLQNLLRRGRSVDSLKHFRDQVLNREQALDEFNLFETADTNGTLWDEANADDFMAELSQWLTPPEKEALRCLLGGLSAREAALQLGVSHTVINRRRSRIASLVLKLGMAPSRKPPQPGPKREMSPLPR